MKSQMTIKEFAALSKIDPSTLRYWDELGLFSPAFRDNDNNYRYYSPSQIIAVNFITIMSNIGVSLKTIKELTKDRNPEGTVRLIEQQERAIDRKIYKLLEAQSLSRARSELIRYGMMAKEGFAVVDGVVVSKDTPGAEMVDESKMTILDYDEATHTLGPHIETGGEENFYRTFVEFCNHADNARVNLNFPIGGCYDDMQTFVENPVVPSRYCSLDPTGGHVRPAGKYLVGYHRGYYGDFGDFPKRFAKHIEENNIKVTGPVYTIYLFDETCINNQDDYLVQTCVRVVG
jgi:DNA-binding transcriptional MerR regulator